MMLVMFLMLVMRHDTPLATGYRHSTGRHLALLDYEANLPGT